MRLKSREKVIIDCLCERGEATVAELCRELYVSEPTVRRALSSLAEAGLIIRTHGGAVYKGEPGVNLPLSFREREHSEAKRAIAARCLELIGDADTVMVDGSSTALALLRVIDARPNVAVITNSAKAALLLAERGVKTYVTGGELDPGSFCYVGSYAESFIRSHSADICFFSVRTLSPEGKLTDNAIAENAVRRVMMENSSKSCLMLDSQKIAPPCLNTLCHLADVDFVVSECDISERFPLYHEKLLCP